MLIRMGRLRIGAWGRRLVGGSGRFSWEGIRGVLMFSVDLSGMGRMSRMGPGGGEFGRVSV